MELQIELPCRDADLNLNGLISLARVGSAPARKREPFVCILPCCNTIQASGRQKRLFKHASGAAQRTGLRVYAVGHYPPIWGGKMKKDGLGIVPVPGGGDGHFPLVCSL